MALNPIAYTEKITRSFLRYQLTAYPFSDPGLNNQMRNLLSLDACRNSPLIKGPFISLSKSFKQGASISNMVTDSVLHPHMRQRIPQEITHLYGHQEKAIRSITNGFSTLISTGTGSGKSECFLYPIISRCLELKDEQAPPGIVAVIVYPMNALAEDQLDRLRGLLAGTGIKFGMYVGKTPERESEVSGVRLPEGSSQAAYAARVKKSRDEGREETIHPFEEVCSRELMRQPGGQPRILLTNVKQLELLLTRQRDIELFNDALLEYLVFDEAHTFTGAQGAETACLVRRLRTFCGKDAQDTVCIATSATIVDQNDPDAARNFAARFFGLEASSIVTITEEYTKEDWAAIRNICPPPISSELALQLCVLAIEEANVAAAVGAAYKLLTDGDTLNETEDWEAELFEKLKANELLFQIASLLETPKSLTDLPADLEKKLGRNVTEEEILAWLTLGAAARMDGRPLVRPVVHAFVRGISGAVVNFPENPGTAKLWLSAEDEVQDPAREEYADFPISTCTSCGQHYFETFLQDFKYTAQKPEGGEAMGDAHFWQPLPRNSGGKRVLLIDHLIGNSSEEELDESERLHELFFCRHCGTAHPTDRNNCLQCGSATPLLKLYAIRQNPDNIGILSSCLSCGAVARMVGGSYREPARPVRAMQSADVHVLAQDMIQNAERKRLLIFSDNRQDAAFQAGWMKDRARRFRLRALMSEAMMLAPASIGEIVSYIGNVLDKDDALSQLLIPEVWVVHRKEGTGGLHDRERKKYLRMQVLREVTLSTRQPIGLEPWGRMTITYQNLHEHLPWILDNAHRLGISVDEMKEGVASILDYFRHKKVLLDREYDTFSRIWAEGDPEISNGYLPFGSTPTGTKLKKGTSDETKYLSTWLSDKGQTTLKQLAQKWSVPDADVESFLKGLFDFLVQYKFLVPVVIKNSKNKPLGKVSDVYQLDADLLRLNENRGYYLCESCRRRFGRMPPFQKCTGWRCHGKLDFVQEDPDNYNLQLLDQKYEMIRPEEHTAMITTGDRERIENLFKGDSEAINTLVCTATLELGVDIGQLDMVLMRNVPPLPANYWQRAGRAGRRHRMAVDITYCRNSSHDRSYFKDPLKLLNGKVDPPAFNMRNEVMVSKHVRSAVITRLNQYLRMPQKSAVERKQIEETLKAAFPDLITTYLFDSDGFLLHKTYDITALEALINSELKDLLIYVKKAFHQGWPLADSTVVSEAFLEACITSMADELRAVILHLGKRLKWALNQIKRLNKIRDISGTLEREDDILFRSCDSLVKKMKGQIQKRKGSQAEGHDDIVTFSVLAAEGFLPGYGLDSGSVLGTAEIPYWRGSHATHLSLPRPPGIALREFSPGNLIYTNNNKFTPRVFQREAAEETMQLPVFECSLENSAIKELPVNNALGSLSSSSLKAIPICDVELYHMSYISDEEEFRFQMGVSVFGMEKGQHSGGRSYLSGNQELQFRKAVRYRMVNVGANLLLQRENSVLGYPICTVCGQSASPMLSVEGLRKFKDRHRHERAIEFENVGIYADIIADSLQLPNFIDKDEAYSVLEALRIASAQVLDMHLEDLQVLVIGHVERPELNAILWDPMPGGSGLIEQMLDRYPEICKEAIEFLKTCPSCCDTSCIDCLQNYRNAFYHKHLNRHVALEFFENHPAQLDYTFDIPPLQPASTSSNAAQPVNDAERRLRELLKNAGFPDGIRNEQIKMDLSLGSTTPDIIFRIDGDDLSLGLLVYLDGMSVALHGKEERVQNDNKIRDWLSNNGYEVLSITTNDLSDKKAMARFFKRIANYLEDPDLVGKAREVDDWFTAGSSGSNNPEFTTNPTDHSKFKTVVPFIEMKQVADEFGMPDFLKSEVPKWAVYRGELKLEEDMFISRIPSGSLDPDLPAGAFCLFTTKISEQLEAKTVLVKMKYRKDPETGSNYMVKRVEWVKTEIQGQHRMYRKIKLYQLPEEQFSETSEIGQDSIQVIAELLEILKG